MVIGNDTYPQLNTFSSFKIILVLIFNSFMSNSEFLSVLYSELTLIAVVHILSHNVSYYWTKVIYILFILITAFFFFFKQGTVVRVPVKLRILIGDFKNSKNCAFSLHCI